MTFSDRFNMTLYEQELFSVLDLKKDQALLSKQKIIANKLYRAYKFGSEHTKLDLDKAAQYEKIVFPKEEDKAEEDRIHPNQYLTTGNFHWLMGWFTSIRLFLSRSNKIAFSATGRAFLPSLFSIGGLSYALTFLVDVIELLFITFWPYKTETEEGLSWPTIFARRFKNAFFNDGERISRMVNDGLWFALNLAAFILTGGVVAIINIAGFAFDLVHEVWKTAVEYRKYEQFSQKLYDEIEHEWSVLMKDDEFLALKKNIKTLEAEVRSHRLLLLAKTLPEGEANAIAQELDAKEKLLNIHRQRVSEKEKTFQQLIAIRSGVEEKKRDAMTTRMRIVVGTTMAFIGTLLVFFPLTTIPGAVLIGGGLALVGGSVMIGLGKRLYDLVIKYGTLAYQAINTKNKNKQHTQIETPAAIIPKPNSTDQISIPAEKKKLETVSTSESEDEKSTPSSSYNVYCKPLLRRPPSDPILIPKPKNEVVPPQSMPIQSAFNDWSLDSSSMYGYASAPDQENDYNNNKPPMIEVY